MKKVFCIVFFILFLSTGSNIFSQSILNYEIENPVRENYLVYPKLLGECCVRRSVGEEPLKKGFFSYIFEYNFLNLKKAAVYYISDISIENFDEIIIPVYGDGSNNLFRIRIEDKEGEIFTSDLMKCVLNWDGKWKSVRIKKSEFSLTKWAKTNIVNKKIDFPVKIKRIYVVKNFKKSESKGKIIIDDFSVIK